MKSHLKNKWPLLLAFCLLAASYTYVLHEEHSSTTPQLIEIKESFKEKEVKLPDLDLITKLFEYISRLLPR